MPYGGVAAFVKEYTDKKYPIALHKAGLRAMQEAQRLGINRVVALADPEVEPAARWLTRLGFKKEDEVWVWHQ